ncbi:MAG TPA: hypothetical protein VFY21_09625 [Xanthobacteraceae bacterium]|nr:hypothetical protein [Xanthobacteraceae bacterium]
MLRTLLRLSGIARTLGSLKVRLEDKADDALAQIKGVAMRIAIAAGLAIASLIFTLLALVTGLVALYAYLLPEYGTLPSLGIVGGTMVAVALLLALAAALVGRGGSQKSSRPEVKELDDEDWEPVRTNGSRVRPRYALSRRESRAAADATDSIASYISPGARSRRGLNEDYSADVFTLMRSGDRSTIMAMLGAAIAAGWLVGRTVPSSKSR